MLRFLTVTVAATVTAAALSACSGGGSGTLPSHRTSPAAHSAAATFTIKWSNPTATAATRHKNTISPSAQSVTVLVNGTLNTEANRTGGPTQSIALDVPVGTDTFTFNVYDGLNAQGHIIGSATVSKLIVDGAANVVSASIQAICTATNVTLTNGDPLTYAVYATPSGLATSLSSIVLGGTPAATLVVGPEDADGNVIIAGTGGTVQYSITGSARVTPIDGAHILLTPTSGARKTIADTLTVAAPTCPTTTVAVQHSPAILFQSYPSYAVYTFDWFGNRLGAGGGYPANADSLIGYDTVTNRVIAYNKYTGQITAYSLDWVTSTPLYIVPTNALVTWSTSLHSVFGVTYSGGTTSFFTYNSGHVFTYPETIASGTPRAVTASTLSGSPYIFLTNGFQIYSLSVTTSHATTVTMSATPYSTTSIAADARGGVVYGANAGSPYISQYQFSLGISFSSDYGLSSVATLVGTDTDDDDVYAILQDTTVAASSYGAVLLFNGGGIGTGQSITVISANEL